MLLFDLIYCNFALPFEYNISRRITQLMVRTGIVIPGEALNAGKVLNTAFLTYVASAASTLLTLLYYFIRARIFGGRNK